MLVAVGDRVHSLKKQSRSVDDIVAAKPTSMYDAKMGNACHRASSRASCMPVYKRLNGTTDPSLWPWRLTNADEYSGECAERNTIHATHRCRLAHGNTTRLQKRSLSEGCRKWSSPWLSPQTIEDVVASAFVKGLSPRYRATTSWLTRSRR